MTAKKPICLNVREWNTEPTEYCIISQHQSKTIDNLHDITRFLEDLLPEITVENENTRAIQFNKFYGSIRAFDSSNEKQEDYQNIEELAKLMGYSGVEWEERSYPDE